MGCGSVCLAKRDRREVPEPSASLVRRFSCSILTLLGEVRQKSVVSPGGQTLKNAKSRRGEGNCALKIFNACEPWKRGSAEEAHQKGKSPRGLQ